MMWEDAEIISTYAPEIIPNVRSETEQEETAGITSSLAHFTGTEYYHADGGLLLTDGVKFLLDHCRGYALVSFIRQHLQAIGQEDGFTVIDLGQDGSVHIHNGRDGSARASIALGSLGLQLPIPIKLFTGIHDCYLVVMLASEY